MFINSFYSKKYSTSSPSPNKGTSLIDRSISKRSSQITRKKKKTTEHLAHSVLENAKVPDKSAAKESEEMWDSTPFVYLPQADTLAAAMFVPLQLADTHCTQHF
jgi:hypothetical protein